MDVFCEKGVFEIEDSRKIMEVQARSLPLLEVYQLLY
jgi:hypothetical protein